MKKKLIVAGAAAALSAAAAVPAFALENEFHGMYKLKYFLSNYDGGSTALNKSGLTAANYFEQRARIFYTAKATDGLKLVTGFEIDSVFGDGAQVNGRGQGGALESDTVNLETKWVYLDFDVPSTPVNMKVGIQPIKDSLKGTFFDADVAGVLASAKTGNLTTAAGFFRAYDGVKTAGQTSATFSAPRGTDNLDIAILDASYSVNKDLKVGGLYYFYSDYRTKTVVTDHVIGLNAEAKFGPATVNGFLAYQTGFVKNPQMTLNAFAGNVTGKVKAGPGTAKLAFLYASGDKDNNDGVNHSWYSVSQAPTGPTTFGPAVNDFNDSGMMLLNRNTASGGTTTDNSIMYTVNNNNQGSVILAAGYDAAITPKLYANANLGIGLTAENNQNSKGNGSHFQGTEINLETGYKVYDNLTASVQAAYVFLGPYYTKAATGGKDPVDPYTARVALTYAF